jgi:hypothetical protein
LAFGATWWGFHTDAMGAPDPVFLLSTIHSDFRTMTTAGVYSGAFGSSPDDARGLLFVPDYDLPIGMGPCPF